MASSIYLHSYSLLLLIILPSVFSTTSSKCSVNSVHLNSSLLTNDTVPWDSPSGHFAFGFQSVLFDDKEFMSVLAVWFAKDPNRTIVWYAKPTQSPAFPSGSIVKLTNKGIVVYDPKGREMWHRPENNTVALVSCASMLDNGSFALLDESGNKVWESFEEPVDTILPGQNLSKPKSFRARQSDTSFYDGSFVLEWQQDSNLVLYYSPKSSDDETSTHEAYWATGTDKTESQLFFDESGHMYIQNDTGTVISEVLNRGSDEFFYMARIDPDGVFRLYRHPKGENTVANGCSSGWWSVVQKNPQDICLSFTRQTGNVICGYNSYCVTINEKTNCECPDHYSRFEHDNLTGCRPDFPLPSCNKDGWEQNKDLVDFKEYTNLDWPLSDYDKLVGIAMDKDMCRQKCLEDCFCAVAIYGDENCWKKKYPLSNGRKHPNVTRIALVKVPKTDWNKGGREQTTLVLVISILLGSSVFLNVLLFVALFAALFIFYHKKLFSPKLSAATTIRYFTYKELEEATTGFKQMLGRGAFGTVYKGVLTSDTSRYVAVKRLDKVVQEGEKEFKTEVSVIGQTHHRNLVRLLGYCDEGEHRLLVYEYMSNGSLASFLFGISRPHWNQRMQISLGIARGLTYLHEECNTQIIHCDIKPQNILLDELFTPRIADFGLAKLLLAEQTKAAKTGLRGTIGYFAPEWFRKASITTKVDAYSFGVVLLEIICCKSSVAFSMASEEALIDWAYRCYSHGKVAKLVENDEEAKNDMKSVEKHVMVAIWCIQEDPSLRPSMKKVTQMLEGVTTVSVPPCPSLFSSSSFQTSFTL